MFALTALATLLALAALLLVQQRSFQSGLLDYVNQLNRERAEGLIPTLAAEYRSHGSWERLRRNPRLFRQLLDLEGPEPADDRRPPPRWQDGLRSGPPEGGRRGPGADGPPPRRERGFDPEERPREGQRRPPPPGSPEDGRRDPVDDGPPPRREREFDEQDRPREGQRRPPPPERPPPPRRGPGGDELVARYALYDEQNAAVIGPPDSWPGSVLLPIQVNGQQVGLLAYQPLPRLESSFDLDFARSQLRSGVVTALLVLLLASLASMVFARRLAQPLRGMADSAQRIAGGDYAARVSMDRGDEIGELARDFNAMAEALQQNRNARQRWTAEISHELRTPIAVMRAELDALEDGVRPVNRDALKSLSAEAQRLSRLVDDLYQLSLADAGALAYRFESLDLAEQLREALHSQLAAFEKAGLTVESELPESAPIRGDAGRLAQLWANLAANSCRYTDRGGMVRVSLRQSDGLWQLCWEDSAPGVPADSLQRMFDPLYRADASRSRAAGGAGLGLAIARRIVDAHGATMHAEASALGGVAIHIQWPRS